jgi:hypothetical protein
MDGGCSDPHEEEQRKREKFSFSSDFREVRICESKTCFQFVFISKK